MGGYTATQTDVEHVVNTNLVQLRVVDGAAGLLGPDMTLGACIGSPEGAIIGWLGDVRFDVETPGLWMKTQGENATAFGWTRIDAAGVAPALAALQAQVTALEIDVLQLQADVLQNTADISTLQAEPYVTIGNSPSLSGERALTGSSSVAFADNGANGTVVASVPANGITNTELADMAANTVKSNPTAGLADPQDLALGTNTVLLRAGGNISAFAVGANTVLGRVAGDIVAAQLVTGQVGDDQITNAKLANMAANTVKANATNASDNPTDVAMAVNTVFARAGGDISPIAFGTNEVLLRAGGNLTDFAVGTNTVLGRVAGDIVAARAVNAQLADMAARTVKANATNGAAAPGDLAGGGAGTYLRDSGTALAFSSIPVGDLPTGYSLANVSDAVLIDLDFTTFTTQDFVAGGAGNYVINGATWTVVNTTAADTFGIVNGTGLRFNAAAVNGAFTSGTQTAAYLYIRAADLMSGWDPMWTFIVEFYVSAATLGQSGNEIRIGYWNATNARLIAGSRRNSGGSQQSALALDTGSNGTNLTNTAIAVKVMTTSAQAWSGNYAAGAFPQPYPNTAAFVTYVSTTVNVTPHLDATNSRVVIAFPTGEIGGNMDATVARLRIRRVAA